MTNKKMNKAWVVTASSLRTKDMVSGDSTKVLAILSARKSSQDVGFLLQNIANTLSLSLFEHLETAKYKKPAVFHEVMGFESDKYVVAGDFIFRAEKASNLEIWDEKGINRIQWDSPRIEDWGNNPETHQLECRNVVESKTKAAVQISMDAHSLFFDRAA